MHPVEQHEERRVVSKEQHVAHGIKGFKSRTLVGARSTSTRTMPRHTPRSAARISRSSFRDGRNFVRKQAVALAQKALALDPTTTSPYRLLAFINM
jgi:hypothetical protein